MLSAPEALADHHELASFDSGTAETIGIRGLLVHALN